MCPSLLILGNEWNNFYLSSVSDKMNIGCLTVIVIQLSLAKISHGKL